MAEVTAHRFLSTLRRTLRKFEHERTADRSTFQITVELERDELDGGWIAEVIELPGCMSQGETSQEALDNVIEAFGEVLAAKMAGQFTDPGNRPVDVDGGRRRETVHVPVEAALC